MSENPEHAGPARYDGEPNPAGGEAESSTHHLPPPAFPPGARRRHVGSRGPHAEPEDTPTASGDPGSAPPRMTEDAFIQPDEPIPERSQVPEDAFISPDEPIIRQHPPNEIDPDDVVVTGIGDDAHLDPRDLAAAADPHVADLVEKVSKLAESLRRKGEAGLRTDPGMSRFEATLRAYCVGYLAGRRAEGES